MTDSKPSYHDLHITTAEIKRTSIFDLPYGYEVSCNRVGGWSLWSNTYSETPMLAAGEYDTKWLILDVDGHVIVDSRPVRTLTTEPGTPERDAELNRWAEEDEASK